MPQSLKVYYQCKAGTNQKVHARKALCAEVLMRAAVASTGIRMTSGRGGKAAQQIQILRPSLQTPASTELQGSAFSFPFGFKLSAFRGAFFVGSLLSALSRNVV